MQSQKITTQRRWYEDACGAAHGMELLGERWTLLVLRELMVGPRRFGAIRAELPGISANVLTQRLEGLIEAGLIQRRTLPPPASTQVYELTPWGYEAEPIIQAIGRWAARSPHHDPTLAFSAASLLLSFRTMFDPGRAAGARAQVGFKLGSETALVEIEDGRLEFRRQEEVAEADVVFTGEPRMLAALIYGGQPLDALEGAGAIRVEGDRDLAVRFAGWFPLPAKAAQATSETAS
jgi:DNA-binding HxlR family transcriptional regulator